MAGSPLRLARGAGRRVYGGKIGLALPTPPRSLLPQWSVDDGELWWLRMVHQTLVDYGTSEGFRPVLVEDLPSTADSDRWKFRLREGLRFHNGRKLDARDVEYSFSTLVDSSPANSWIRAWLADIRVLRGRRAFELRTRESCSSQLLLSVLSAAPLSVISRRTTGGLGRAIGPFRIDSSKSTSARAHLVAHAGHALGRPYIDAVDVALDLTPEQQRESFHYRDLDLVGLRPQPRSRFQSVPGGFVATLVVTSETTGLAMRCDRRGLRQRLVSRMTEPAQPAMGLHPADPPAEDSGPKASDIVTEVAYRAREVPWGVEGAARALRDVADPSGRAVLRAIPGAGVVTLNPGRVRVERKRWWGPARHWTRLGSGAQGVPADGMGDLGSAADALPLLHLWAQAYVGREGLSLFHRADGTPALDECTLRPGPK